MIIQDGNGEALDALDALPSARPVMHRLQDPVGEDEEDDEDEAGDTVAPLRARSAAPAQGDEEPGHVVLLLDASGSMRTYDVQGEETDSDENGPRSLCRMEAAVRCAGRFAIAHSRTRPKDLFSLALFNDQTEVLAELVDPAGVEAALEAVTLRGSGGTHYRPALSAAARLLAARPDLPGHVVVLSDGRPADTKAALELFQKAFGKAGARVHCIGFGATVESFAPLQQLACLSGGAFLLSGCTMRGLCGAFSSVSSTITSMSSGSGSGSAAQGAAAPATRSRTLRPADFEVPENGTFGSKGVLCFRASRGTFRYDGTTFHDQRWPVGDVARRARPYMCGGMRLVYGFRDTQVVAEGSWMVAKSSRYLDEALNTQEVVETHAKSTAVARHFAARFNELRASSGPKPTLFFVPCFVYEVEGKMPAEGEPRYFAGERYLPGVFLKYNSNNGYVSEAVAQHHEIVQAFLHFSFAASAGTLLVADLQGVARETEALLTDPQVLSLAGGFGPGDLRAGGMCACLAAHRCGPTCRQLGLKPVSSLTLHRLGSAAARARQAHKKPSTVGSDWEVTSEAGSASAEWDRVPETDLVEFALSDGHSSQASSSSWVHLDL